MPHLTCYAFPLYPCFFYVCSCGCVCARSTACTILNNRLSEQEPRSRPPTASQSAKERVPPRQLPHSAQNDGGGKKYGFIAPDLPAEVPAASSGALQDHSNQETNGATGLIAKFESAVIFFFRFPFPQTRMLSLTLSLSLTPSHTHTHTHT
jgi:hypothetical protein